MPTSTQTLERLVKALSKVDRFKSHALVIENGFIRQAQLSHDGGGKFIRAYYLSSPGSAPTQHIGCDDLTEAFSRLGEWFSNSVIYRRSIQIDEGPDAADFKALVEDAWCECITPALDEGSITSNGGDFRRDLIRSKLLPLLKEGAAGVPKWNGQGTTAASVSWQETDCTGFMLKECFFSDLHLNGSKFDQANLEQANFRHAELIGGSFQGARLKKAVFSGARLNGSKFAGAAMKECKLDNAFLAHCDFADADLAKADLRGAYLEGADFSAATTIGAKFDYAVYDEQTKLPLEFPQWHTMFWRGEGPDPYRAFVMEKFEREGCNSFDEFKEHVTMNFDGARISNAFKMLKKDRFQLYSEIDENRITGVVKSQKNPDLVYACSLSSDGTFFCGTQNLKPCGGLGGELCKHIFVLTMGLAKSKELDMTKTLKWIFKSLDCKPSMNKPIMTEVFLKYKGAEAGEVDWRPTETVPEDYYAY